ncbi:MAG TPA: SRPBCC family protein [Propionibacteriaceae bacterium]|nr:SRPBCC family protein [Propionibacteriaceae bacterium]
MPQVVADVFVPIPPDLAFAVSRTTGTVRLRWDPFIRRQYHLGGATSPAKGVLTQTFSRLGPQMVSRYVSYAPPRQVGMTMVEGLLFFRTFAAVGASSPRVRVPAPPGSTPSRPSLPGLIPVADRVGSWLLGLEIRRRIVGHAKGCADPVVLASARTQLSTPG